MGRLLESPPRGRYSYRLTAIETGTTVFRDNLLLGVGFNGFDNNRPAVAEDWLNPLKRGKRAVKDGEPIRADGDRRRRAEPRVAPAVRSLLRSKRASRHDWRQATPHLLGMQLWLIAVLAGNQGALWFLSNAASGFFIFAVAGLSARVSTATPRCDLAPSRS